MWGVLIGGLKELGSLWLQTKRAKAEAEIAYRNKLAQQEADWDIIAQQQAQHSWKDEMIALIWYSPLYVGWLEERECSGDELICSGLGLTSPTDWVAFVDSLPNWWWFGAYGIMAAVFGLRWYFKSNKFPKKV